MAKLPQPITRPNLGLYLDRDPLSVPARAVQDGYNFRIKEGILTNYQIGWQRFAPNVTLDGPVKLVINFKMRDGTERLVFGTMANLYRYDSASETVTYLTPIYATGTVNVSAANPAVVTGTGTLFSTHLVAGDKIAFGGNAINSIAGPWYTIATVGSDTSLTLTGPITGAPLTGVQYTARKVQHANYLDNYSAEIFLNDGVSGDDLLIVTNGVDPILSWNGSDPAFKDAGLPFRCKALVNFSNMMIYGNLLQSGDVLPTSIINSDIGKPLDTTGGLSEQFVVHSGYDGIVTMVALGDNLAIYCANTGVLAQFLGDPLVFAFRRVFSGYGPLGPGLVADYGDYHEFVGADTLYRFDGGVGQMVDMHVWRTVLLSRDPTREKIGFSHFDQENAELIWVLPLQADDGSGHGADPIAGPDTTYTAHYLEQMGVQGIPTPYSARAFPFTAAGYFTQQEGLTWDSVTGIWDDADYRWNDQTNFLAFPVNIVGDTSGRLYTINTAQRGDGELLPGFVRFGRRALGDGRMRGLLDRVYPHVIPQLGNVGSVQIRTYVADFVGGAPVLVADQTYSMVQSTRAYGMGEAWVSPKRRGRYMELELFHAGTPDESWGLAGYDIDLKAGGRR